MESAVQQATGFEQLLERGEDGPYIFSQMFSADGWRARSRSKRTFKLLKKIDAPLRGMLREGERVFFVTRGVAQPGILEWYFLGAALYYLNQRAIVLTNQRILLLQIDWRQTPKEMRNEIAYASVARLKNTWSGSAKIEFHNGGKVVLNGVPKQDRKWMASTFERLIGALEAPPTQTSLENLCPHCYAVVAGLPAECPGCGGRFKSPRMAGLLSLVFPGAGDMYLGHSGFAYLEIVGATLMWLVIMVLVFAPDIGTLEAGVVMAMMIVFGHGIDAFTTHRMATKGLLPDPARSHGWRFGAAAVVPLIGIGALAATAPAKARLRPDPGVVTGEQLRPEHLDALRDAGFVEPDESVLYFYSGGLASILQDGNLFTNRRIVSYEQTYDQTFHQSARFEEVVDLNVDPHGPSDPIARVTVVREDGTGFALFVGTDGGGDVRFIDDMTDRWRSARSGMDGIWFDGGAGTSPEDAVVVHGTEGLIELESAVGWWMSWWYGERGGDWSLSTRSVGANDMLKYLIELPGGGSQTLLFEDAEP